MSADALLERLRSAQAQRAGAALAGDELARVIAALAATPAPSLTPARQELLYLQAASTHPGASALGMLFVRGGGCAEPPEDPAQWPYQNVIEAIADGWRVIAFPDPHQVADAATPAGLGCEFILERWR